MSVVFENFNYIYQYADNIGFLLLSALGLVIIFSVMGVINMAHGEFMMIGAYITAFSYHAGLPVSIAIILGGVGTGFIGIILELFIIRHIYKQPLSSLIVTWGISLILTQGFLILFGPSMLNVPTPLGSFELGSRSYAYYRLVLFLVAVFLITVTWLIFTRTGYGIRVRAVMEKPEMAESLGVNSSKIYVATFGLGSVLAGIAGSLFALTAAISPTFGQSYTTLAFITVVVGGASSPILGLVLSSVTLAGIQTVINNIAGVYIGYLATLIAAFLIILKMPNGISGYLEKIRFSSSKLPFLKFQKLK